MTFPDVTALLIAHLDDQLDVPVSSEVPAERPARFLQVRRIGGTAQPPVRDFPNIDLRSWDDDSEPDAMALLLEARALVWQLTGQSLGADGPVVYSVSELAGPRQTTDQQSEAYIATMTASLSVRADEAYRFSN